MKKLIIIALMLLVCIPCGAFAQKKSKKIKDKRFEPIVLSDAREYAGHYIGIEPSYVLEISARADGKLTATSLEGGRRATLEEIKLEGARLTAKKVYTDGSIEKFEAQFVNRILNGERAFGIMVEGLRIELAGATLSRVFYRRTSTPVTPS